VLQHRQRAGLAGDVGDDALDEAGVEVDADGARGHGDRGAQLGDAELGDEHAVLGVVGDLVEAEVAALVEDELAAAADEVDAQRDDDADAQPGVAGDPLHSRRTNRTRWASSAVGEQLLERVDDQQHGAAGLAALPGLQGRRAPSASGATVVAARPASASARSANGAAPGVTSRVRQPEAAQRGDQAGEDERGLADPGRAGDDDEPRLAALAWASRTSARSSAVSAVASEEGPACSARNGASPRYGRTNSGCVASPSASRA
jgi:hypothetical protein